MKIDNDTSILRYKQAGLSNTVIALKLGLTEHEVAMRYQDLLSTAVGLSSAGYNQLAAQFQILCHQYQLLGESLKCLSVALANAASPGEIQACLSSDPSLSFQKLVSSFIILRAYTPPVSSLEVLENQGN